MSPGAYIFQRPFLMGLFLEGLMYGGKFAFQNRLGQLIVGRKFTVFAMSFFAFQGNFQVQAPGGAYIRRGDFTEGLKLYKFGGLIFEEAYTWRGLFSEFHGISSEHGTIIFFPITIFFQENLKKNWPKKRAQILSDCIGSCSCPSGHPIILLQCN